jgi:hypothetical protein
MAYRKGCYSLRHHLVSYRIRQVNERGGYYTINFIYNLKGEINMQSIAIEIVESQEQEFNVSAALTDYSAGCCCCCCFTINLE